MKQEDLEKKFKRFKKKYFANHKDGFTGLELEACRSAFFAEVNKQQEEEKEK